MNSDGEWQRLPAQGLARIMGNTIRFITGYDDGLRESFDIFHLVGILSEVVSVFWSVNITICLSGSTVIGHPAPKPPPIQPPKPQPPKPPPPPPPPPPKGNHGSAHPIALPGCERL
jgi:hypothetical protein